MDNKSQEFFDLEQSIQWIAKSLEVGDGQVRSAAELLDAGNTIPFIARYRKEATRGLDELALREIEDLSGVAVDLFEVARPARSLDTEPFPGNSSAVQVLVGIKGDDQVTLRLQKAQHRPKHFVAEVLTLIDKDGVEGLYPEVTAGYCGQGLLHDYLIVV